MKTMDGKFIPFILIALPLWCGAESAGLKTSPMPIGSQPPTASIYSPTLIGSGADRVISPCPASLSDDCSWPLGGRDDGLSGEWRATSSLRFQAQFQSLSSQAFDHQWVEGDDLSLSCRLDAGNWGNLELGLQVSRWRNELSGGQIEQEWNGAALGLGWERGAFSGDLTSRRIDGTGLANDSNTLDISVAWRTPWNAKLSVGASNVLDQSVTDGDVISDPGIDSVLGRVPYVRYQQDL